MLPLVFLTLAVAGVADVLPTAEIVRPDMSIIGHSCMRSPSREGEPVDRFAQHTPDDVLLDASAAVCFL